MKKVYKGVIFDLDGTLLNTLDDLHEAVNHVLLAHGEPGRTLDEVRRAIGNGNKRLMELCLRGGAAHPDFEEIFQEYVKFYRENDTVKTRPYEGIMELLSDLKSEGIKIAIISNKIQKATTHLWEHYFKEYVDIALGDDGIRPKKPAGDAAYKTLEMMGLLKDQVLYIGDSPVDAKFSEAVGMDCLLVSYGYNEKESLLSLRSVGIADKVSEIKNFL